MGDTQQDVICYLHIICIMFLERALWESADLPLYNIDLIAVNNHSKNISK